MVLEFRSDKRAFLRSWGLFKYFGPAANFKSSQTEPKHRTASMLRGMCVVLQNLRNRPELNDLRGNVVSVQDDDRLCVRLDTSHKILVVRAENLRQYVSPDMRKVQTFEFPEGTSEEEIAVSVRNFCRTSVVAPETELRVLLRPENSAVSALMSEANKGMLVQSARLEHMGKLSRTAMLLGWVATEPDVNGVVVYINDSLRLAVRSTKEMFLHHTEQTLLYVQDCKGAR